MSDLIDRAAANAALEKLDELMRHRAETEDKEFVKIQAGITLARCEIDAIPTVEAAPVVHARWMQKHHIISLGNVTLTGTYPTCNLCGYAWIGVAKNTNYCPNCGAKMDADAPERAGKEREGG